uniref:Ribonuclease P protein subunit p29 n=1 Tax=Cacopsylla melanoneura TaxID=428564 RepID=A0A8D9B5N5_9HEMI
MSELLSKLQNSQKVKLLLSLNNIVEKYPDQDTESLTKEALRHLLENASTSISDDEILQGLTKKIYLNKNINTFIKRKVEQSNSAKPKIKCRRRNKELSAQEKRALHIRRRRPEEVSYSDAITLWQHWCAYVERMEWHQDRDGFNAQLNRADMNGVLLNIIRAKNPSHVGMKGVVVMDRKCTFTIVTEKSGTKIIPKAGCVFEIFWTKPDEKKIQLFGKYFCIRPEERATRRVRLIMVPIL